MVGKHDVVAVVGTDLGLDNIEPGLDKDADLGSQVVVVVVDNRGNLVVGVVEVVENLAWHPLLPLQKIL